jgi:ADP-ribose pyrophosphatase
MATDTSDRFKDHPVDVVITQRETVFTGRVWNVEHERFDYNGEEISRDYVDHTGAVAVLVLDESDRFLAIQQYRHPIRMREWEIPAGLLDIAGENALFAAQRELAEEVDLVADTWNVLTDYYTSPGGSNEIVRIFLARDIRPTSETYQRTEEEADMVMRWVEMDEAVDAVLAGRVCNSILQIAVLAADASKNRGWASLKQADEHWQMRIRRDERGSGAPWQS